MRNAFFAIPLLLLLMMGCSGTSAPSTETKSPEAEAQAKRDSHPDYKAILGTWTIVSSEWDGQRNGDAIGNRYTFENLKLEAWLQTLGDLIVDYEIDPTKEPKQIDVKLGYPPRQKIYRGIYELDGERLKICFRERERPTGFKAERGSGWTSHVLERSKDQDSIINMEN